LGAGGPFEAHTPGGADTVEVADADRNPKALLDGDLEGVAGCMGMGLAMGNNPLRNGTAHLGGMAMPLILKGAISFTASAQPNAISGRATNEETRSCDSVLPGHPLIHFFHQACFRSPQIGTIIHRYTPLQEGVEQDDARFDAKCTRYDRLSLHGFGAWWRETLPVYHELRQRLVVRDSLIHMRTQARNQRHALQQWPMQIASVLEAVDAIITKLDEQIGSLDDEIAQVLAEGAWAASAVILLATPGLGPITTEWLLVGTLNFSLAATPEQLTAYIGLAPVPRESGTSVRGRRRIGHAGNSRVRMALYLATLNAARYNRLSRRSISGCGREASR